MPDIRTHSARPRSQDLAMQAIKDRSELLSSARQIFDRLAHLQNNKNPNKQGRIVSKLKAALEKARAANRRPDQELKTLRKAFLEKYKVTVNTDNSVKFTIPKGLAIIDLLRDAQTVSFALRGVVAIYPPRLANWMTKKAFTRVCTSDVTFVITPLVKGTNFKSRYEQVAFLKKSGLRMAKAFELAGAHAVFSVFKNKILSDLFKGNIVRVKGTKLYYGNGGLSEMDENDYVNNCSYRNVKAAAARKLS